jgi:hypothetical protein
MEDQELSNCDSYFCNEKDEILKYDVCSHYQGRYDSKKFTFVGRGIICMVRGTTQCFVWDDPENILYFYTRKEEMKK